MFESKYASIKITLPILLHPLAYKTHDIFNLAKKLTLRKAANVTRVLGSYYAAKASGRLLAPGMPFSLAFEPTTSCNLRCPECPSGLRSFTRPTGMLDPVFFQQKIDELKDYLIYLTFYFQGEPYLHPQFTDMVHYASTRGIYTATSTNAHYLTDENAQKTIESGLDRLIISIDGTTQNTYESYRVGGSLDKVMEGTNNLLQWKKKLKSVTPHVVFQFLVVKQNEHQVSDVYALADRLGVDAVQIKTAQIYDYKHGNVLIPDNPAYSRYRKNNRGEYELKNPLENHCWKMWHSAVITWDGKVVPCCFDKDAQHAMGDLRHTSFREVWYSEKYQAFRRAIFTSRSKIDICQNCSEGLSVLSN